ncbi:MAG: hypothetical protein ABIB71_05485 [Candidatus Woesearchaeota archaeon]
MADLLMLEDEDKEIYLSSITKAVMALKDQCQNGLGYKKVAEYCTRIVNLFELLDYKRLKERKTGIKEYKDIGIDPSASGFPNTEWLRSLYVRRTTTGLHLNKLPSIDSLVERASTNILNNNFPEEEQELLTKVLFYHRLREANIPEMEEYKFNRGNDGKTWFSYSGMDLTKSLFVIMDVEFNYYANKKVFSEKEEPGFLNYFRNMCFSFNARRAFLSLNGTNELMPVSVTKYVIGPFYFPKTENTKKLVELFDSVDEPEKWLLRFRKEYAECQKEVSISDGVIFKSDIPKAICSDQKNDDYALCPYPLQRALDDAFRGANDDIQVIGV